MKIWLSASPYMKHCKDWSTKRSNKPEQPGNFPCDQTTKRVYGENPTSWNWQTQGVNWIMNEPNKLLSYPDNQHTACTSETRKNRANRWIEQWKPQWNKNSQVTEQIMSTLTLVLKQASFETNSQNSFCWFDHLTIKHWKRLARCRNFQANWK